MNVTSVSCLGKYLATGMPVVSRRITIDGDACAEPCNVVAPVGTSLQALVDFAGVKEGVTLGKVIAGGGVMGPAVPDLSAPTTKTSGGLLMLSAEAAATKPVDPCIHCGRCVEYCPLGLEPVEVAAASATRAAPWRSTAPCARPSRIMCWSAGGRFRRNLTDMSWRLPTWAMTTTTG